MWKLARPGPGATGVALYLLLAFASFLPLSLRPRDTVAYVGDSLESAYLVAWNVHQAFRAPARLFDANVLHPHRRALAFTDHRLLPSVAVAPVVWATGNPILAANVAVALACLLAALGARRLASVLGADAIAAWAAGALYGFHTYQVNEGPRLNIVTHGFIPLALAELLLYWRTGDPRRAGRVAVLMLLQGLSSNYHLLYGSLLLAIVVVIALVAAPRTALRRAPWLLGSAVVAGLVFAPVAMPYLDASRQHGYSRDLPVGIDLEHYVSTASGNFVHGARGADVRLQQRGPHFIGFVSLALALAAVGLWAARRKDDRPTVLPARVWIPAAGLLALLFVALSLGRDVMVFGHSLGPGPYRLLHRFVPGFQMVRIPERLSLIAMLFIALLAARTLTVLGARRRWLAVALAAAVPLEHLGTLPISERVPVTHRVPEVYRWIAGNPVGALAEVPVHGEGLVREETLEMYFSAYHFKRTIHGYTAYPPLLTRHLRRLASEFPSPVSLQGLQRVGVDTVVVHHGRPLGADLARQLRDTAQADRFSDLLQEVDQDLYDRLPAAQAAGRIRLEARFDGPAARLFRSTADEVYRIGAPPPIPVAGFPGGRAVARDPSWRLRAKAGDPVPAFDGDMRTAWVVPRALLGDEFLEATFPRPVVVAGVVLRLRRDSVFPTRFRVAGLAGGRWTELARYDAGHALQLLDRLLADPRSAAIGFEFGRSGRELRGISLLVEEGGTSFEGWSIPEVEVRVH